MKGRFNIAARVWLSVGIFAIGFVAVTMVSQIDRTLTERDLKKASETLLPAEQAGHQAEESFRRTSEAFRNVVILQDAEGLGNAAVEGRRTLAALNGVMALDPDGRNGEAAARLSMEIERFLADAQAVYPMALKPGAWASPGLAKQLHPLAGRTANLQRGLMELNAGLARNFSQELMAVRQRSERVSALNLSIFGSTFVLAVILVDWTIRRAITRPLRKTELALARERDLLRVLLDNIPDFIYFKDRESRFIRINKAQADLLGVGDPREAYGRMDRDFFSAGPAEASLADEQRIVATGEPLVSKIELVARPGLSRWVTTTKMPVKNEAGEVTQIVGISRDVTAWKEAVDALEESEGSFRLLFDSLPHAVWVYEARNLRCVAVNKAAIQHYGYTPGEFQELCFTAMHPADEAERFLRFAGKPASELAGPWRHVTREGTILDVEVVAHDLEFAGHRAVLLVAQDVSDRNRMQLELQQAQRLEAVGQLAAGIAHEINTPIQYVGDNIRFILDAFADRNRLLNKYIELRQALGGDAVRREILEDVDRISAEIDVDYLNQEIPKALAQSLEGVERVANIVRAMKAFAHPGQQHKAAADLNKCLADALIVARNTIKYVADVETDYAELPPVMCHVADMNQVFLNLLVNAADAIREVNKKSGERGVIRVSTAREGDRVMISIGDTGCGIPASIKARVFDPFFTTKDVGKGTGQGLAIARTIIEKHNGSIGFEANGSSGTIFRIYLPIGQPEDEAIGEARPSTYAA